MQLSVSVRNAMLDAIETTIGTSPLLRLYSGAAPADCATSASGTKLAEGSLPSDWANAASGGSKTKLGTYTLTGVSGAGAGTTAGYYRIYDSGDTACHEQGTITATGGGGDMTMDNTSVANGQTVSVTTFTHTAANA